MHLVHLVAAKEAAAKVRLSMADVFPPKGTSAKQP